MEGCRNIDSQCEFRWDAGKLRGTMTARLVSAEYPKDSKGMNCKINVDNLWNKWDDNVVESLDIES